MQHRFFFSVILFIVGFSLLTGCAKKEDTPGTQSPVPQAASPSSASPAAPAPSPAPVPAAEPAAEKGKVREAHENFVETFNAAISLGNGMDALKARIQAAENAREAGMKMRGELDNPADLLFLNKFLDGLQEYSDKGHAYVSAVEEAEKLYSEIKEGQETLKKTPQKEQAQAITKLNEKTIRYNDLYKGPLPKQRDELEALGKALLSMDSRKG